MGGNQETHICWITLNRLQRTSLVAQMGLPTMWETWVQSLGWEDPPEKEMAPHSSTLAWEIPWTKETGRLQSMGSQKVEHDWETLLSNRVQAYYTPYNWFWFKFTKNNLYRITELSVGNYNKKRLDTISENYTTSIA